MPSPIPLQKGIVVKVTTGGYGFLRPQSGGRDVRFHVARWMKVAVLYPAGPQFTMVPEDGTFPTVGMGLLYIPGSPDPQGRIDAVAWGVVPKDENLQQFS